MLNIFKLTSLMYSKKLSINWYFTVSSSLIRDAGGKVYARVPIHTEYSGVRCRDGVFSSELLDVDIFVVSKETNSISLSPLLTSLSFIRNDRSKFLSVTHNERADVFRTFWRNR